METATTKRTCRECGKELHTEPILMFGKLRQPIVCNECADGFYNPAPPVKKQTVTQARLPYSDE